MTAEVNTGNATRTREQGRQRQAEALRLYHAGLTMREVAARLGYSLSGVHKAIHREQRAQLREVGDRVLELELERLDRLQLRHFAAAVNGDTRAADMVLRIMARRARYLGLDKHPQTDATRAATDLLGTLAAQIAAVRDTYSAAVVPQAVERGTEAPACHARPVETRSGRTAPDARGAVMTGSLQNVVKGRPDAV
ncbi:hypothetical protein [Microbacterium caowuchunii]|uniref:Uncharacterized protein n=1 Tax=Microbacterium caowuchunii TaxID=2614638 RepID=A0A5N0TKW0_9MICO|nr:hypothetical protein [Microbacterium caowuchunii]KAA9135740.1 hypothetical protein F6B40_00635 [Microbacterium caowuchunii]